MSQYVLWGLGVLISFILFWVSYRKTIGAKNERIENANKEIEKILVRLIATEDYKPTIEAISKVIDGKARDHKVDPEELHSEMQFLNSVYARIMESELITKERREEAIARIMPALATKPPPTQQDEAIRENMYYAIAKRKKLVAVGLMGLLASLMGASLAVIPKFLLGMKNIENGFLGIAGISMGFMVAITLIKFLLTPEDESASKARIVADRANFEKSVFRSLERSGMAIEMPTQDTGYDLIIKSKNERVLVAIKYWPRPIFSPIVENLINQLESEVGRLGAKEAILITSRPLSHPADLARETVKLISLDELKGYLQAL